MKFILYLLLATLIHTSTVAQSKNKIIKSWIKVESEDLYGNDNGPDTLYTRYTFTKQDVHMSFYPAWDDYNMKYILRDKQIQIGFQDYIIEELTDTTFTIHTPGFRRIKFKSEEYLCQNPTTLRQIGEKNSIPIYIANDTLSPRYLKGNLGSTLDKNKNGYNVFRESYFRIDFTITEKGKVEEVVVINSIAYGYDKSMIEALIKTSGQWKPAYYNGNPVRTRMFFERKYLNSSGMGNTSN